LLHNCGRPRRRDAASYILAASFFCVVVMDTGDGVPVVRGICTHLNAQQLCICRPHNMQLSSQTERSFAAEWNAVCWAERWAGRRGAYGLEDAGGRCFVALLAAQLDPDLFPPLVVRGVVLLLERRVVRQQLVHAPRRRASNLTCPCFTPPKNQSTRGANVIAAQSSTHADKREKGEGGGRTGLHAHRRAANISGCGP
jgi:hypothetical protein